MTPPMNRREAIRATTAMLGGVLITSNGFLVACSREQPAASKSAGVLSTDDQMLIEEIADTLLPTTAASPGAKAAGAGAAINLLVTDCWEPERQQRVVAGLKQFRTTCNEKTNSAFEKLPAARREALLREVDAEAQRAGDSHYFGLVRDLALQAYFSSEVGMTKARRWILVPGKWVGCTPLKPGQPAWA